MPGRCRRNNASDPSTDYALNPDLRGLTAMQRMGRIVDYAGIIGGRAAARPAPVRKGDTGTDPFVRPGRSD
jgi:hypothetical protein